jgi:hypothetical protein
MRRLILVGASLIAVVVLAAGCASTDKAAALRETYVMDHPDLTEVQANAILAGEIVLGMDREMVTASWGEPTRTEDVQVEDATEHWVYGNVFMGGTLTSLYFDEKGNLVKYEVGYESTHTNSGSLADRGVEDPVTSGALPKPTGKP